MKISLWFDGGNAFGFGNVRRSLELGDALRRAGHEVRFCPLSPAAAEMAGSEFFAPMAAETVVLDIPYAADEWVQKAQGEGARIVALDFEGTIPPNLIISLQAVRSIPTASRFLCGIEYAIIRDDIRKLKAETQDSGEVLVIVGGGDRTGLTMEIVEKLPHERLCVIQGPNGLALNLTRDNVRVLTNPPNLPRLMADCAWAVTTGGTTMLEMLCLGKAVQVVPRTEHEESFAGKFWESGALLGCGLASIRVPAADEIRTCGLRGQAMVDGRGTDRIIAEIESL